MLVIWYLEDPFNAGDWTEPVMQAAGYTVLALGFGAVVALAAGAPPGAVLPRVFSAPVVATTPALLLAWASWHLYEKQCLKLTRLFPYGRRP